ncbi:MAG: methylmalonyl-CoA mutase, partial [Myxococcales bacterium]|nr:methylmalonyl-CoA mutase [Myxococcales bacterium]
LRGGLGVDPLGALAAVGTLSSGLAGSRFELAEAAAFCRREAPGVRAALVSTRPYHDAGAHAAQEIAWATATGVDYLRALTERGLSIDDAAQQVRFAFSVGGDFFTEIAKLRAARWLWSKVVAASGGGGDAQRMVAHACTSRFTTTQRDPWVNLLRGTAEAAAAALGGADSIAVLPFDAAIGASTSFAARVARNTQLVLREEAHLARVADAPGGSWYVESLTEALARAAWTELQRVEAAGGMADALAGGVIHAAVRAAARARAEAVATRRAPIVGVSEFASLDEAPVTGEAVAPAEVEASLGRPLRDIDPEARHAALAGLIAAVQLTRSAVAPSEGAVFAAAVDAVRAGADLTSVMSALRRGYPSVHVDPLRARRAAEPFEVLRDAGDRLIKDGAARPRAFLAKLGPLLEHKARAAWVRGLLAAGGIEARAGEVFEDPGDAGAVARAFKASGARVAVLCGTDERYEAVGESLARALSEREEGEDGARMVALAGRGGAHEDALRAAGVGLFLYRGVDVVAALDRIHRELGVTR